MLLTGVIVFGRWFIANLVSFSGSAITGRSTSRSAVFYPTLAAVPVVAGYEAGRDEIPGSMYVAQSARR